MLGYDFYYNLLDNAEDADVTFRDLAYFDEEKDLDDIFFEAKVEVDEDTYRLRITEDHSPPTVNRNNYTIKLSKKRPRGDSYKWWAQADEEYKDASDWVFEKILDSFIEDQLGIEFDENQRTL